MAGWLTAAKLICELARLREIAKSKRDAIPLDAPSEFQNNWHFFNAKVQTYNELIAWTNLGAITFNEEEQEEAAGEDKAATELASEEAGDNNTAVS